MRDWPHPAVVTDRVGIDPNPSFGEVYPSDSDHLGRITIEGVSHAIQVVGGDERTESLLALLYTSYERSAQVAHIDSPALIFDLSATERAFRVDRDRQRVLIQGPYASVSQVKIAIRLLVAFLALRNSTGRLAPLHAVVLELPNAMLAVLGASKVGKSFLSSRLAASSSGRVVVADWTLFDAGRVVPEFERATLRRGTDRGPLDSAIELFEGEESSPESRFVSFGTSRTKPIRIANSVTHAILLTRPFDHYEFSRQSVSGLDLLELEPRFSDEALALLGTGDSDRLVDRYDQLFLSMKTATTAGFRSSDANFALLGSDLESWLDQNESTL